MDASGTYVVQPSTGNGSAWRAVAQGTPTENSCTWRSRERLLCDRREVREGLSTRAAGFERHGLDLAYRQEALALTLSTHCPQHPGSCARTRRIGKGDPWGQDD